MTEGVGGKTRARILAAARALAAEHGMRAVTVRVSQEQGVAGFVFPGDRVDVVLAQELAVKEGSAYPDDQIFTAETIVRNVRVLATDQRYDAVRHRPDARPGMHHWQRRTGCPNPTNGQYRAAGSAVRASG